MSKKNQCRLCDMPFSGGVVNSNGRGVCYDCLTTCIGLLNREVVVPIPDLSWDDVEPDVREIVLCTLIREDEAVQEYLGRVSDHRLGKIEERLKTTRGILSAAIAELRGTFMTDSWSTYPPDRSEFVHAVLIRKFRGCEDNATESSHYGLQHHAARCQKISRAHLAAARRLGWAGMPMPS